TGSGWTPPGERTSTRRCRPAGCSPVRSFTGSSSSDPRPRLAVGGAARGGRRGRRPGGGLAGAQLDGVPRGARGPGGAARAPRGGRARGVRDLRRPDRGVAPDPRGMAAADRVRGRRPDLEPRQSRALSAGEGVERGRAGLARPAGRGGRRARRGLGVRRAGGDARGRRGRGGGRDPAGDLAVAARRRRARGRGHGRRAELGPDGTAAGPPGGRRDAARAAPGPLGPGERGPCRPRLAGLRRGVLVARPRARGRRRPAPRDRHRRLRRGLPARLAGAVRARRRRSARTGAHRPPRPVARRGRGGGADRGVAPPAHRARGGRRPRHPPSPPSPTGVPTCIVVSPRPRSLPRRPALVAAAILALWPAILSLPMLAGRWLASPWSDQYTAGYPFHAWSAEWWRRTGHVPLWNPELFGGLPFVAAGHGDIFYPTWLLRLLVPVTTAGNLSFALHYLLAGLFTYALLRRLGAGWTGAVVGGLAYELSGLIASYPSPGHDGKLFASTALPLAFLALVLALRERRWAGYPLLAVAVALALLGHFQLAYYLLIAAGLFALYLTFEEAPERRPAARAARLALALGAVLLGFGIAAIQILPFFGYIPF